jgi:hypothetical protein
VSKQSKGETQPPKRIMSTTTRLALTLVLLLSSSTVLSFNIFYGLKLLHIFDELALNILNIAESMDLLGHVTSEPLFVKKIEKKLINHIDIISKKIDAYEEKSAEKSKIFMDTIMSKLPERLIFDNSMNELWKSVTQIESVYQNFVDYSQSPEAFETYTLKDFASNTVSSNLNAIPNILDMIHKLVVPTKRNANVYRKSILHMFADQMQV